MVLGLKTSELFTTCPNLSSKTFSITVKTGACNGPSYVVILFQIPRPAANYKSQSLYTNLVNAEGKSYEPYCNMGSRICRTSTSL